MPPFDGSYVPELWFMTLYNSCSLDIVASISQANRSKNKRYEISSDADKDAISALLLSGFWLDQREVVSEF